jgi:hypothetical protein
MEQHREKEHQMYWPHFETQCIREKITEDKIEGKVPRGRPRDEYVRQTKKKVHCKKYQEVSQLLLDRVGWRASVNQS